MALLAAVSSIFFRCPDAPRIASLKPKDWTPIWRQNSHFRPPGFWLIFGGFTAFGAATMVGWIVFGWDTW